MLIKMLTKKHNWNHEVKWSSTYRTLAPLKTFAQTRANISSTSSHWILLVLVNKSCSLDQKHPLSVSIWQISTNRNICWRLECIHLTKTFEPLDGKGPSFDKFAIHVVRNMYPVRWNISGMINPLELEIGCDRLSKMIFKFENAISTGHWFEPSSQSTFCSLLLVHSGAFGIGSSVSTQLSSLLQGLP